MKFSTLAYALTTAVSATTVSAFVVAPLSSFAPKTTSQSDRHIALQMSADSLEHGSSPPTIITDDSDEAVPATPAFRYGSRWFRRDKSSSLPLGIKLHGGEKLHSEGLTGKGVKVAVIDSGVAAGHPGFGDQVVKQVWFRRGGSLMQDDHGTHVAGTIHMMAPEAEIYDYRVFGPRGMGVNRAINTAIDEAIEEGCNIINMSLGGPIPDWNMYRAIRKANRAGALVIVAAGNGGDDNILTNERSYPANFSQCVNIGAVAKKDNLPTATFTNTNDGVDYCGIGVDVVSFSPDGTFQEMSGTSMATPHVCGFITALMTKGGAYSDIIKDDESCRALLNDKFVIDVGAEGVDNATGLGFLTYLTRDEFEKDFLDLPEFE